MKVILEFNLPEDEQEHRRCVHATDLCSFIWDFQDYLRTQHKYADPPEGIDKIYEKWFDLLGENDIHMDKLYT